MDPTDHADLQLWYDADQESFTDGTSITTFSDRSGNARHGTPSSGTVATLIHAGHNGRKVARMANTAAYFSVASPFTCTDLTVTFVTKHTTDASSMYVRSANSAGSISLNRTVNDPLHVVRYLTTNGASLEVKYSAMQSAAKMSAYTVVKNAGVVTVYLNGEPMKVYGTPSTVDLAEIEFARLLGTTAFQADVGEIFAYNVAKSASDVRAMFTGYLRDKWNLAPKAAVFGHGNSLTNCIIKDLQYTLRDEVEAWDKAWPGQDVAKLELEFSTWAMPRFSASRAHNIYIPMEAHNGLDGSSNQESYFDEYKAHCLAAKATAALSGITIKVIAVTNAASDNDGNAGSADWQSAWAYYNGRIRNEWADFADGLADIAALPEADSLADTANATYYDPDGIHHTTAFEDLIGEQVFTPAVQAILDAPASSLTTGTLNVTNLIIGAP
jgi:hypothetical protein